jgi:hypothetical protein
MPKPLLPVPHKAGDLGAPAPTSRDILFINAGFNEEEQTALTRKVIDRVNDSLDATITRYFAHEGVVTDSRVTPDNKGRLEGADMACRLLGLAAPRAEQKVTVVYKLELPAWALPDNTEPQVIEVKGKVE